MNKILPKKTLRKTYFYRFCGYTKLLFFVMRGILLYTPTSHHHMVFVLPKVDLHTFEENIKFPIFLRLHLLGFGLLGLFDFFFTFTPHNFFFFI